MALVIFTQQLARFLDCPTQHVQANSLRAALDEACAGNPRLRGYVIDEQGELRRHVAVFIDGRRVRERVDLSHEVGPDSQIHVLQALSGG
jgi:molybdopterin synthase sulfur carrier subunit